MRARLETLAGAAALAFALVPAANALDDVSHAFLKAINSERAARGLAPVALSESLTRLAQDRAMEISASDELDFEPLPGDEELVTARAYGYPAWLAQELAAVNDGDPCDIVAAWTGRFVTSEVYLRHEAKDIGVGAGMVGESPLYVLLVGVPSSEDDPLRKRFPGVAPREWLTARLVAEVNKKRFTSGRPSFSRSRQLDEEAQKMAEILLSSGELEESGVRRLPDGGPVLYYKARGHWISAHPEQVVWIWFQDDRQVTLVRGQNVVGAGLASRGADDNLEAVWTLAIENEKPE